MKINIFNSIIFTSAIGVGTLLAIKAVQGYNKNELTSTNSLLEENLNAFADNPLQRKRIKGESCKCPNGEQGWRSICRVDGNGPSCDPYQKDDSYCYKIYTGYRERLCEISNN